MAQMGLSLSDWIMEEITKTTKKNKSRRIEELIIKGLMAEKEKALKESFIKDSKVESLNKAVKLALVRVRLVLFRKNKLIF